MSLGHFIKSYSKINIHLGVVKKEKNDFHSIETLVSNIDLYDVIYIKQIQNKKNKIVFTGNYAKGIGRNNTISKLLNLLEDQKIIKKKYLIKIKKNIPLKSGMGGGSMNAASLLNFFNKKNKLNLSKKKMVYLCTKIGSDVRLGLNNYSKIMFGSGEVKSIKKFKSYLIIVMPNFGCSTKRIYQNVKKYSKSHIKISKEYNLNNCHRLYNDLEKPAFKLYPKLADIKKTLQNLPNIKFARMTGSGSAMIGYFLRKKDAFHGTKILKKKYKNYWCILSKTI